MVIFITATDTGVGKTMVSSLLARGLTQQGVAPESICYFKPVQTGPRYEDVEVVRHWAPQISFASLYHYPQPSSPDQAQKAAPGLPQVRRERIAEELRRLSARYEYVLCEGAGGLYVPLDHEGSSWWDVLKDFPMQILLVVRSALGTLNHSALSLRALEYQGLSAFLVVMNGNLHKENEASLRRMFPDQRLISQQQVNCDEEHKEAAQRLAALCLESLAVDKAARSEKRNKARDYEREHIWHPFTQHQEGHAPLWVQGARDLSWTLESGERILDGISSWWVSGLGHGREELGRVLAGQQQTLDHVLYGGVAHEPAALLAGRLVELAQLEAPASGNSEPLKRVFYSDNGSTAVEVALKMAYSYSQRRRSLGPEPRFLAVAGGYHGDTLGAMSVSAATRYHTPYAALFAPTEYLQPQLLAPVHRSACYAVEQAVAALEEQFAQHHASYLALICEPLLQGAGGMLIQHPRWLEALVGLCRRYGVPVIFDEVFTGYGRLGFPFAFQKLGMAPDILCTSKGLTSGTLPLAVCLATEEIFAAFLSARSEDALLHGHTFTAHATACAVALKVLDLYHEGGLFQRAQQLEGFYERAQHEVQECCRGLWQDPRIFGSVWAFEVGGGEDTDERGYFAASAQRVAQCALRRGLFVRPLSRTLYLAPALTVSEEELMGMCRILTESLVEAAAQNPC